MRKCYCCKEETPTRLFEEHYVCQKCIDQVNKSVGQIKESQEMEELKNGHRTENIPNMQ